MTKKTTPATTTGPERVIYCGPSIPSGSLKQYTVYKNGLPEHLTSLLEKCPEIKELFVPIADLAKTQTAIKQPGSIFYRHYQIVQQFCRKGAN